MSLDKNKQRLLRGKKWPKSQYFPYGNKIAEASLLSAYLPGQQIQVLSSSSGFATYSVILGKPLNFLSFKYG